MNIIALIIVIAAMSCSPVLAQEGNYQYYQNPNYPLQGSMRINRNAPYNAPVNAQPFQSSDYSSLPPMPNYPAPGNMQPNFNTGYPMPGSIQPFTGSNFPVPGNTPAALRHQAGQLVNQAYELSNAGNNEQAIVLLKQAEALDSSSAVVHLDLSAAYMALKRYDEALQETTIVLKLNPDDEKGYLNYLAAAIGAGRMQDALRVGQEYLNRFPNGQNRTKLSNEMVAVEHELDRRANARGIVAPPGAPENYLFFATPDGIHRWPPGSMPLKVYINPGYNCKGFLPDFQTVLINSFLIWQNATCGVLGFIPVDNPRIANIECQWTDSAANITLAAEAGEAKVESVHNAIYHVVITFLTCRPESPSEKLSLPLLQQVSLHEIGHALGIDGHSDKAQDIMYCSTNPNVEHPQLSQRDINTLYLIYQ